MRLIEEGKTTALRRGLTASMRWMCAATAACDEIAPLRICSANSLAVKVVRSTVAPTTCCCISVMLYLPRLIDGHCSSMRRATSRPHNYVGVTTTFLMAGSWWESLARLQDSEPYSVM